MGHDLDEMEDTLDEMPSLPSFSRAEIAVSSDELRCQTAKTHNEWWPFYRLIPP